VRAVTIALACLALAPAGAGAAEFTPLILDLRLNAQADGVTVVVERDATGELWLAAADLQKLRLAVPDAQPRVIDGTAHYPLAAFAGTSLRIDEATQSADIAVAPGAFVPTRIGYDARSDVPVTPARPGAFINYDVSVAREDGERASGAQVELGFFDSAAVATTSFVATDTGTGRDFTRLDTAVTRDFPEQLATLRVGDSISTAGAWGQAARYAGVHFGTNFATQPTLVTTPLLGTEGVATVPSTVDVFVNGRRIAREDVPPGPFSIERLPAINGAGEMQVVVTDVLGRQQVLSQPYYSGSALLRAGLDEYAFDLGSLRSDFGVHANRYGDLAGAATWRRGLTERWTGEAHLEFESGGATAVGLDSAWRVGDFAIASSTLAASASDSGTGWLTGVGLEHNGPRFNLFGRARFDSERLALIGQEPWMPHLKLRTFLGGGMRLSHAGSIQVAAAVQSYWDTGTVRTLSATWSLTLFDAGYLSLSASHSATRGGDSTDVYLMFTMPLGDQRTASVGLSRAPSPGREDLEGTVTLQKNHPLGAGYGYYSMLSSSGDYVLDYGLYGSAGNLGVQLARRNDVNGQRLQAQGGIAITEVGVLATRPLDQSFAVVEVADYPDLTVYLENHPIGRTDEHGRLLIDRLRPYEANRISLDPREVPMDAALATREIAVAPRWRSGPVVRFPVEHAHALTLHLVRDDGTPVPAGAQVVLDQRSFPVALGGLVYLEGVTRTVDARAQWSSDGCAFEVVPAASDEPMPDLGTVTCVGTGTLER
jgi:outer membrane usher protein